MLVLKFGLNPISLGGHVLDFDVYLKYLFLAFVSVECLWTSQAQYLYN